MHMCTWSHQRTTEGGLRGRREERTGCESCYEHSVSNVAVRKGGRVTGKEREREREREGEREHQMENSESETWEGERG